MSATMASSVAGSSPILMIRLSVLDLAPITQGSDAATAFRNTLDFARHAERLGFHRYWLAEHHNMPGIASAATSIVIGHVAAGTRTIRVGAGGIMLPNHAPLLIAEQFGTLESLFPGRIDLGLGRAPGTDAVTAHALRRTLASDPDRFPQDVLELITYFGARPGDGDRGVRAVPGAGLQVPIYILGSSTFGAQVAGALGLPFAFASHFAAAHLMPAIEIYRSHFRPSAHLAQPYTILGINVVSADTEPEARLLATSGRESFANLRRGMPTTLPPPNRAYEKDVVAFGAIPLEEMLSVAFVGTADTVADGLRRFVAATAADELIAVSHIYDHAARVRSLEILAEAGSALRQK
jgi:luciferase family oxidoreductase group 1